jgi:hypothetical protein
MKPRFLRTSEVVELNRHACHHLLVLPVAAVHDNVGQSPHCGVHLEVRWRVIDAAA